MSSRLLGLVIAGAALMAALVVLSVIFGLTQVTAGDVQGALARWLGFDTSVETPIDRILIELRMPRAILGLLVGAGLGVVGVLMQTVTRNDLADPFLFGLSSGAATGAVFVITVSGNYFGFWTMPLAAFTGGLLAAACVLFLVHKLEGRGPEKLVLAGLAVSFLFTAATNYLVFAGDNRAAHTVIFWMLGGLGLARWDILPLVCFGLVLVLGYGLYQSRRLDALLAGEMTAQTLGVNVAQIRQQIFLVCALGTAVFVSISGVIGFVGLMVPHMGRALVGPLHGPLVIISAVLGSLLLCASDLVSRIVLAPQELPVGVITTSLGAIFVFVLLVTEHRRI